MSQNNLFGKRCCPFKKILMLALQMMLGSLIPPLRGRIRISALPAPLRLSPISSVRVPLQDVRRQFSNRNNSLIENHLGGRGPFANSLRKLPFLQRPLQLTLISRLFSLNPRLGCRDLLITFFAFTGTVPQIPMTRLKVLESIFKWRGREKM